MTSTITQIDTSDPVALARWIHDDVLQSLGVAVLGVDLCRRLHQKMRYEQALDELTGIVEALGQALESSEQILPDLDLLMPPSGQGPARPSLVVAGGSGFGLTTCWPSTTARKYGRSAAFSRMNSIFAGSPLLARPMGAAR